MRTVLVTGFGPYAEETDNPSGAVAARLDGDIIDDVQLRGWVLPVGTNRVGPALVEALEATRPDVVVVTGVTPGRAAPSLERVAINLRDFPIPDIDGLEPIDDPVIEGGPDAYLSTLPIKAILARWREGGIAGYVSNTAGTYVCNQTFYLARHLSRERGVAAGLVHIPVTPERAGATEPPIPSMSLDLLEQAVRVAAVVAATHSGADLRLGAGAVS